MSMSSVVSKCRRKNIGFVKKRLSSWLKIPGMCGGNRDLTKSLNRSDSTKHWHSKKAESWAGKVCPRKQSNPSLKLPEFLKCFPMLCIFKCKPWKSNALKTLAHDDMMPRFRPPYPRTSSKVPKAIAEVGKRRYGRSAKRIKLINAPSHWKRRGTSGLLKQLAAKEPRSPCSQLEPRAQVESLQKKSKKILKIFLDPLSLPTNSMSSLINSMRGFGKSRLLFSEKTW